MNNRGESLLLAIMAMILIFMAGMLFLNHIKDDVSLVTGSSQLACDSTTLISDGTKVLCLGIDIVIPYLLILTVSVAGGILANKFLL